MPARLRSRPPSRGLGMLPILLALVAVLASGAPGGAQVTPPERWVVLFDDVTGRRVPGAVVRIEPGGMVRETDVSGTIRVTLPQGEYLLTITALGYGDAQVRLQVPDGPTGPLELALQPSPVEVQGLEVSGQEPEPVDVAGVVRDATDGRPLVGATVSFPFASRRWVALTDPDGRFRIPGVRPGRHWIQATHLGYEGAALSVGVEPESTREVEIDLRPDTALLRGVATIEKRLQSDRRAFAGSPVQMVDRSRIARNPWWRDPGELLRSVGVVVLPCEDAADGAWCVAARGGRTRPVEVCIDGFMVHGGLDQLRSYHPRELHLVEVFKRGALIHGYTVAFMGQQGRRAARLLRCPDPNVG